MQRYTDEQSQIRKHETDAGGDNARKSAAASYGRDTQDAGRGEQCNTDYAQYGGEPTTARSTRPRQKQAAEGEAGTFVTPGEEQSAYKQTYVCDHQCNGTG